MTWIWALILATLLGAGEAYAGWLVIPSVRWNGFSVRPEGSEATPNYYGYGAGLSLGYSLRQVMDLAVFGHYLPGRQESASFGVADAVITIYGGEVGFRLAESVYLGLRGGLSNYELSKPTEASEAPELTGKWGGPAGGISIGAIHKVSKSSSFQTCFEVMHAVVTDQSDGRPGKRKFDGFSLSFAYVFNGYKNYSIENTIFKDFLDSIIFY